jgi:purine-nucleoside phosphorylase
MHCAEDVKQSIQAAKAALGPLAPGTVGLVAGTGLSGLAASLTGGREVACATLPGFPRATAPGHEGRLVCGEMAGRPVALLAGRLHLYEGYSPREVAFGVRLLAGLGLRTLIVTNAAGALDPGFAPGGLMRVTDHINLTGRSPLTGPNDERLGPRFPDMSQAYCPRLGEIADRAALSLGLRLERGVYAGVLGPNLETPAETRMLRLLGADAVGMSTVIEVIAARHLGLSVLAISCLTNRNLPDCMAETSLEEVLATARAAEGDLARLLSSVIQEC